MASAQRASLVSLACAVVILAGCGVAGEGEASDPGTGGIVSTTERPESVQAPTTAPDTLGDQMTEWARSTWLTFDDVAQAYDDVTLASLNYDSVGLRVACSDLEQAAERMLDRPPPDPAVASPLSDAMRYYSLGAQACQDAMAWDDVQLAEDAIFFFGEAEVYLDLAAEALEKWGVDA